MSAHYDRFPLPGEAEHYEPAQFHPDPNDPEQAAMAEYYDRDTQEPVQTLPEPVAPAGPRETGQFTGPMPARPTEKAVYEMPAQIAQYHRDFREQQIQQAAQAHQGDYFLAPPQRSEVEATQPINEGRFGFRALRGAIRRMRQR